jgi:hypothetical protein
LFRLALKTRQKLVNRFDEFLLLFFPDTLYSIFKLPSFLFPHGCPVSAIIEKQKTAFREAAHDNKKQSVLIRFLY